MSPHRIVPSVGAFLIAMLIAGILQQQRQIRLRSSEIASLTLPPDDNASQSPLAPGPGAIPLSPDERQELLRLRREVGEGRRTQARLRTLETQHQRLNAQLAAVTQSSAESAETGPYLPARHARFVGTATPRDTLESFLAAARLGDTHLLFQILDESSAGAIRSALEHQGPEKLFEGLRGLPGFRVRKITEQTNGTAQAEIEFDPRPGAPTETLSFQPVDGGWRLNLRF